MTKYYLRQRHSVDDGVNIVFDENFQASYLVSGRSGKKNDEIHVQDMSGTVLVRIQQTSFGILPRFILKYRGHVVGSISLTLGHLGDIVYVRHLNWLISGNFIAGRYFITHNTKKLLSVKPDMRPDGIYNKLIVTFDTQAPVHIAIAALLDIWGTKSNPLIKLKWLPGQGNQYELTS
ncbi:LURP-one-related/scramblase family protein [Leuconostoc rapi]|uniref:LURP-one-related/scramblase family protein n=1 Tax=Leuconostoc rapi TaxID=1406906 RepID=UPI0019594195|nr:hypothetical protein [Leuconostoc rapi]MBM7434843.1 uncharacterized protein YxjI [Leuconostoc rapi]